MFIRASLSSDVPPKGEPASSHFVADCINEYTRTALSTFQQCGYSKTYANKTCPKEDSGIKYDVVKFHTFQSQFIDKHLKKRYEKALRDESIKYVTLICEDFLSNRQPKEGSNFRTQLGELFVVPGQLATRDLKRRGSDNELYQAENCYGRLDDRGQMVVIGNRQKKQKVKPSNKDVEQLFTLYERAFEYGQEGLGESRVRMLMAGLNRKLTEQEKQSAKDHYDDRESRGTQDGYGRGTRIDTHCC